MDYCVPRHPESRFVQAMNVANEIKKKMICPVHRRKILFNGNFTDGCVLMITRYCCREHAECVAQAWKETELFNHIYIINKD